MFDSHNGDVDIQQRDISIRGCVVVSSGVANSGVIGRSERVARIVSGNTITVDMFGNVFARDYEYKMVTHARVFSLEYKFGSLNHYSTLYIATLLKHLSKIYSYNNMASFKKIANEEIKLPVVSKNSRQIDFAYMEAYIRELESARIRELESARIRELDKWLIASGLNDYQLTQKEKKALDDYKEENIHFNKYKVCDLFLLKKGKRLTKKNMTHGTIRFIGATAENNGITAYISNDTHIHPSNTITVSYNGSVGEAFYQTKPFWASDDINVFYPKFNITECLALYFIQLLRQEGKRYSYTNKWTKEKMEKTEIMVPVTLAGGVNFDYIELFIRAIIKQTIRGVVEWKDREIVTTKSVINK